MGADEAGTLHRLRALRQESIEPLVTEHHGRVVKWMGDGVLVEFSSVVDALSCALAWQSAVAAKQVTGEVSDRIVFRIGINVGDVIVEDDDIYGDGVNIAARLEGLAHPGGICVSEDAYRQSKGKLSAAFEDMGDHQLKNVVEPVRVYRVVKALQITSPAATQATPLPLPDKPSIAVLAFTNMSGDTAQEHFSDGIADDIITELSRFQDLFVIARKSSFAFRDQAQNVQSIAAALGVRYLLEGGVRTVGKRIRINAQLIEAETGHHLWAERYDRNLEDVFALQDEISRKVASTVVGRLRISAQDGAKGKRAQNLQAYDYLLQGRSIVGDTEENNERAKRAYQKAIELDPACARAYMGLAQHYIIDEFNKWGKPPEQSRALCLECTEKAASLDKFDSEVQWRIGFVYTHRGEFDEAKLYLDRALELNPNDADALSVMGVYLTALGKGDEAVDCCKRAIRLNPFGPAYYLWNLANACYCARRYDEALVPVKEYLSRFPKFARPRHVLAAALAQLGRLDEAKKVTKIILAAEPDISLGRIAENGTLFWKRPEEQEHWLEGLRLAGIPE
jgi:adenylate cyclase